MAPPLRSPLHIGKSGTLVHDHEVPFLPRSLKLSLSQISELLLCFPLNLNPSILQYLANALPLSGSHLTSFISVYFEAQVPELIWEIDVLWFQKAQSLVETEK